MRKDTIAASMYGYSGWWNNETSLKPGKEEANPSFGEDGMIICLRNQVNQLKENY